MRNGFIGIAAAVFFTATTPVFAQSQLELTLDAYVAVMRAQGATVEYSDRIADSDGTVEFRDFKVTAPEDDFTLNADWVRFTPQPLQPEMTLVTFAPQVQAMIAPDDLDEPVEVLLSSDDLKILTNAIVVDPMELAKVDFRMSAGTLQLATAAEGSDAPVTFDFLQSGMDLSVLVDHETRRVTGAYKADDFVVDYSIDVEGTKNAAKNSVAGLATEFFFDMPDEERPETYLSDGKEFSFSLTSGASSGAGSSTQQGMTVVFDTKSESSEALLEHVDGALSYNASGNGFDINVQIGDGLPPMRFTLSKALFDLAVPTRPSDTAGDVRLGFVLSDFTADEAVWSMIDGAGAIPRDPALIDVRLAAKLQLKKNIEEVFSPTGPVATGSEPPTDVANVESLDITALKIAVGGASLTADGGVTFDNSGPFPIPAGSITVIASGIQKLSTTLVELGLLDQMQAGMAMGMIMAFAKPGDQPDQFISEISFTENGILANGVPIQP